MKQAAVLTISDKGSLGERKDTSGPALVKILEADNWQIIYTNIIPDEIDAIKSELLKCTDKLNARLVLTTGGTGFSPRDVTPEATLAVIQREVRGIPEAMRAESMKITPMGCLSRAVSGIRGTSLIINLPGSEKAACECFNAVKLAVSHGTDMLAGQTQDCGVTPAKILAVCISENKGEQKHSVKSIKLKADWGIPGDAHAGKWHRQVSLLAVESVEKLEKITGMKFPAGAFAENILTQGITLHDLHTGQRIRIGTALCEVTQIGKECHNDCAIRKAAGDCVMPREGVFVKVIEDGEASSGDAITLLS
ncbi:MAG: MOSC domain-containing protein [Synergistaceae bacterium]|nr:MOSC domain-containing protein [Synergistaceae bacterium]MBR0204223.1 MOSC domain-containing protein [Synergistaceae bacterium]